MAIVIILIALLAFLIGLKCSFNRKVHCIVFGIPLLLLMWMLKDMELNLFQRIAGGVLFVLLLLSLWTFPTKK